jgi:hypothetical protein
MIVRNTDARCYNCPYWKSDNHIRNTFGVCQRHSPGLSSKDNTRTLDYDWCGEHPDILKSVADI